MKSIDEKSFSLQKETVMRAIEPDVLKLANLIAAYAPHDGVFELHIQGVHAIRRSQINTELVHGLAQSSLCIVAQGAKSIMLGEEVYDPSFPRGFVFR